MTDEQSIGQGNDGTVSFEGGASASRPVDEVPTRRTGDLGFAAYLMVKGMKMTTVRRVARNKFQYFFADPDGKYDALNLEYANSPEKKFDDEVRGIKKMISRLG